MDERHDPLDVLRLVASRVNAEFEVGAKKQGTMTTMSRSKTRERHRRFSLCARSPVPFGTARFDS
jgi:hypothetical protein